MVTVLKKKTDAEIQQDVLREMKWDSRVEPTDTGVEVESTPAPGLRNLREADRRISMRLALVSAVFAVLVIQCPASAGIDFDSYRACDVGWDALVGCVGDWNEDGHVDAVVTIGNAELRYLPGDGTATFWPWHLYFAHTRILSVVPADIDGDGHLDIAAVDALTDRLIVLLGDGQGAFVSNTFDVADGPRGLAVADFNGDGHLDAAAAARFGTITVLDGDGTGGFIARRDLSIGSGVVYVLAPDLDEDGRPDLVLSDNQGGRVLVLRGQGDGTFAGPVAFPAGSKPFGLALGDFDQDGHVDIAAACRRSNSVVVLLGDGAGGLGAPITVGVTGNPISLVVGDLDEDGDADIATTTRSSGSVSVVLGDGSGGFATGESFACGRGPLGSMIADFDEDGHLDVAAVDNDNYFFSVLRGDGSGRFIVPHGFTPGFIPGVLASADFDEDGRADLAVNGGGSQDVVGVFGGDGSGGFSLLGEFAAPAEANTIVAKDVNGDLHVDVLLVVDPFGLVVLLGDGAGSLGTSQSFYAGSGPGGLVVADFDENGTQDVAIAAFGWDAITVLYGDGAGGFGDRLSFVVGGHPGKLAAGDFNGDGHTDLAVPIPSLARAEVLLGDGTGGFALPRRFDTLANPIMALVADVDADGHLDFATYDGPPSYQLSTFLGDGTGDFAPQVPTFVSHVADAIPADFDEDGWPDIAIANHVTFSVKIHPGRGGAWFFGPFFVFGATGRPRALAVADFDGDGHLDIAASAEDDRTSITVLLNTSFR